MKKVLVVKIGGNIIDSEKDLSGFLKKFSKIRGPKILVHGGGKLATRLCTQLGIETKMIEGRRVTDAETLKVTTMVYAGWINKSIAARLNALKCPAIGISGADVQLIPSRRRKVEKIDYGFVGDVIPDGLNLNFIENLLEQGVCPVICPITATNKGQLLNTNADAIASVVAVNISQKFKTQLIYCFEKPGVMNGNTLVKKLTNSTYRQLKEEKIITEGMIPKLDNAFLCLNSGVKQVIIGSGSKLNKILHSNYGTHVVKERK